jgi:fumarate reductase flavoprotein subunit
MVFNAKSVILATGGFDRNEDYMNEYAAEAVGESTYVATGNVGDGLTMAEKVNAQVVGNGSVIGFKAVEGELNLESEISSLIWSPFLLVNKEGKRFVNEASDYPIVHEALLKQTDKRGILIFDGTTYNPLLDKAVENQEAFVADSLEELADMAGVDKAALLSTVDEYNQMIATGTDTLFGKDLSMQTKVETPKYYGVKIIAASIGTMTGLKIDTGAHVLDKNNNVIPNLYAAGEVANGEFFYKVYPSSGTSIQMSLTFGRIAGTNAASVK